MLGICGVLLLVVWLALPRLICFAANTALPRELGPHGTLLLLHPAVHRLPPAPIVLQADPALLRRMAAAASNRWIPPGVVRHGLGAVGTLRGAGNTAIGWHAYASDGEIPPRLAINLTPAQADALLATAGGDIAGMRATARLSTLELAALPDDGDDRRFRVEASGALLMAHGILSMQVPVRHLVAQVTIAFAASANGWEPRVRLAIEALDAPLPNLPGLDQTLWQRLLAGWIEERIANAIAGRSLPPWFPTDIRLAAVVR